jgi:hypothetical protein
MGTTEAEYKLVYEGAVDDSADTLRKVKGVLIADLELSIPEVQTVLATVPAVLKTTKSEDELTNLKNKLAAAGAKVLIVKPVNESADDDGGFEAIFELNEEDLGIKPRIEKGDGGVINIAESTESLDEILGAMNIPKGESVPEESELDLTTIASEQNQQASTDVKEQPPLFEFATAAEPIVKEAQAEAKSALLELNSALQIADEPASQVASIANPPTIEEPEADLSIKLDEPVKPTPPREVSPAQTIAPVPTEKPSPGKLAEKVFPKSEPPKKSEAKAAMVPEATPRAGAESELVRESQAIPAEKHRGILGKLKVSPSLDLLLPILIGLVILWVGNSLYMSSNKPQGDEELIRSLERLVSSDTKAEKEERPVSGDKTFTGSSSTEFETATASITLNADKLKNINLEIVTPEPPRLTAQQLVRNEVRAPWARKIETRGLEVEQKPDGSFTVEGVAKLYVSYKGEMLRAIGTLEASGKVDTVDHRVVLSITVKVGEPDVVDRTNIVVDPSGKIRFYSSSRIVVATREVR